MKASVRVVLFEESTWDFLDYQSSPAGVEMEFLFPAMLRLPSCLCAHRMSAADNVPNCIDAFLIM